MIDIFRKILLKDLLVYFIIFLAGAALLAVVVQPGFFQQNASAAASTSVAKKGAFVCPMHPEETSDHPGNCSICGMAMVKNGTVQNVAILIFDGVQIIDYTGPYEVFGQKGFHVYTVAEKSKPIITSMDMSVNPTFDFTNAPEPYILLVPGGNVDPHLQNPVVIKWIQDQSRKAQYVLSVCNGAFFLAKAGMLDGLTATTFHHLIDDLKAAAPKAKVVRDQRFVDNGKIITSAGLTSGIDATIYLISKIYGLDQAKELALHLEYNWQPDSKYARANLADKYLGNLNASDIPNTSDWQSLKNLGGAEDWEIQATCKTSLKASELLQRLNKKLADIKWTQAPSKTSDSDTSYWTFIGDHGETWNGTLSIKPLQNESGKYVLALRIQNSKKVASEILFPSLMKGGTKGGLNR